MRTILALVLIAGNFTPGRAQSGPLVVGLDAGTNPFVIVNPDGSLTGFNIDLVTEVAKRLGRPGVQVVIAVGTPVAGRPPHRSQRARFGHWAPTSGG
ncbi:MAG: transporter substrate-binding domain-containing protein [Mycobacterium sp.]